MRNTREEKLHRNVLVRGGIGWSKIDERDSVDWTDDTTRVSLVAEIVVLVNKVDAVFRVGIGGMIGLNEQWRTQEKLGFAVVRLEVGERARN